MKTLFLLITIMSLAATPASANTRERRKPTVRSIHTEHLNKGLAIPTDIPDAVVPCGDLGVDISLWASSKNDAIAAPNKIRYIYSPCLHFLRAPDAEHALYMVEGLDGDSHATVTLFLVRYNSAAVRRMINTISHLERMPMRFSNLVPVPLISLDFMAEFEYQIPFEIYVRFPHESDMDSTGIQNAEVLPVRFEVPEEYLDEFEARLQQGFGFVLRYLRVSENIGGGNLSQEMNVTIDSNLEREMFGKRDRVWATQEQLFNFMTNIAEDNRTVINVQDEDLLKTFIRLAEKYMDQASARAKRLEDFTIDDIPTNFGLDPTSEFFSLDFTTLTDDQRAEAYESIDAMKKLYQEYSKKSGGVGVKVLWGLFGGGVAGSSESEKMEALETFKKFSKEMAEKHHWEGKKSDPLKQKLYEVVRSDLNRFVKSTFDVRILKGNNLVPVGAKVHTVLHTIEYDKALLRKLHDSYPNTKLPTKGSPRRIR